VAGPGGGVAARLRQRGLLDVRVQEQRAAAAGRERLQRVQAARPAARSKHVHAHAQRRGGRGRGLVERARARVSLPLRGRAWARRHAPGAAGGPLCVGLTGVQWPSERVCCVQVMHWPQNQLTDYEQV